MKKKSTAKQKPKKISAAEFDEKFDNGEDIIDYLDLKSAVFKVNVKVPFQVQKKISIESKRQGISEENLIVKWLTEKAKRIKVS